MATTHRRPWMMLALGAVVTVTLSACSPGNDDGDTESVDSAPPAPDAPTGVVIEVPEGDVEQEVLGEIYRRALEVKGQAATVEKVQVNNPDERYEWLTDGSADIVIGCTGEAVRVLSPADFRELNKEAADDDSADPNSEELSVESYEMAAGVLPPDYDVPDFSPAQACPKEASRFDSDLAQNVIPIFRTSVVDREGRKGLNLVTRFITTDEFDEIIEKIDDDNASGDELQAIVDEWFEDNFTSTLAN